MEDQLIALLENVDDDDEDSLCPACHCQHCQVSKTRMITKGMTHSGLTDDLFSIHWAPCAGEVRVMVRESKVKFLEREYREMGNRLHSIVHNTAYDQYVSYSASTVDEQVEKMVANMAARIAALEVENQKLTDALCAVWAATPSMPPSDLPSLNLWKAARRVNALLQELEEAK